MIRYAIYLLGLLSISYSQAYCQIENRDGYIITLDNDTIYGKLDYPESEENYTTCYFTKSGITTTYGPKQILGYGYKKGSQFTSTIIEDKFVEMLVTGKLSLYKLGSDLLLVKDEEIHLFAVHQDEMKSFGGFAIKEDGSWQETAANLTRDCIENATDYIKSFDLTEKDVKKIAEEYNLCKKIGFERYKDTIKPIRINFGGALSLSQSSIKLSNVNDTIPYLADNFETVHPNVGLVFLLSSPKHSKILSLQTEFHFSKAKYTAFKEHKRYFYETFIDLTSISIPISIKFRILNKKISYYGQLGIKYDYNVKSEAIVWEDAIYGTNHVFTDKSVAFEIEEIILGYWVGMSIGKTFNHFDSELYLRYYYSSNLNKTVGFDSKRDQFVIGIILMK